MRKLRAGAVGIGAIAQSNDYYKEEIAHFIDCVITRKPPLSEVRQGLEVMRMLDAIRITSDTNDVCRLVR